MNKRGVAQLVIFGIPVTAIIIFIFQMWTANMVFDAVQPELQKALMELGDSVVCPPELENPNFNICIRGDGEVVVNGKVDDTITIELDSSGTKQSCIIHIGDYIDKRTCRFDDFHVVDNFYLLYNYKATTFKLNSKNFEAYIFANQYIKIPVKKWNWFWKVTRYIPK